MPERIFVGKVGDFEDGELEKIDVELEGQDNPLSILVTKIGNHHCAILNECSHKPLPLDGEHGELDGQIITCKWHNSRFNFCTGSNLDWVRGSLGAEIPEWVNELKAKNKKPTPLTTYPVIEEDGQLFVEFE